MGLEDIVGKGKAEMVLVALIAKEGMVAEAKDSSSQRE